MRILALIISAVILSSTSFSAEKPEYAIDKIPDALKSKANAVIRNRVLVITVLANGTAEENCHTVISILNKNGEDYGVFTEFYNKFSSISNLEGAVYDEKGKRIEKLSDDFNDFSAISGFSLYEDNRVKFCRTKIVNYPITIEYSYKRRYKGFFVLPGFLPYPGYNVAVESSSYTIIEPNMGNEEAIKVSPNKYFKAVPTETKADNNTTKTWPSIKTLER